MVKTKRAKPYKFTESKKKKKEDKNVEIEKLNKYIEKYSTLFVIELENHNSQSQLSLQRKIKGDFYFGKKTFLQVALKNKNKTQIANQIKEEQVSSLKHYFLFTNEKQEQINKQLQSINETVYAQPGEICQHTINLQQGNEVFKRIPVINAEKIKDLGLFVTVRDGKIYLEENVCLCQQGEKMSSNQCKILKMLGIKTAQFKARVSKEISLN